MRTNNTYHWRVRRLRIRAADAEVERGADHAENDRNSQAAEAWNRAARHYAHAGLGLMARDTLTLAVKYFRLADLVLRAENCERRIKFLEVFYE